MTYEESLLQEKIKELEKQIEVLQIKVNLLSSFAPELKKCKSCKNPYVKGYVCACGRDNSYSDEEWNNRNK